MNKLQTAALDSLIPCHGARNWAVKQPDLKTAWDTCPRSDWMLWVAARCPSVTRQTLVLCACDCAESALDYATDSDLILQSLFTLHIVREWAEGREDIETVREASSVGYDYAASSATNAVVNAASSAAYAAAYADADASAAYATYTGADAVACADAVVNAAAAAAYAAGAYADAASAASSAANAAYAAAYAAYAAYTGSYAAAYVDADAANAAYAASDAAGARKQAHLRMRDLIRKRISTCPLK